MPDDKMEQARELVRQQGVPRPRDLAVHGLPCACVSAGWRKKAWSNVWNADSITVATWI